MTDSFFGVFDGHNGPESAMYTVAHILDVLLDERRVKTMPKQILGNTFEKIDQRLCARSQKDVKNFIIY